MKKIIKIPVDKAYVLIKEKENQLTTSFAAELSKIGVKGLIKLSPLDSVEYLEFKIYKKGDYIVVEAEEEGNAEVLTVIQRCNAFVEKDLPEIIEEVADWFFDKIVIIIQGQGNAYCVKLRLLEKTDEGWLTNLNEMKEVAVEYFQPKSETKHNEEDIF